MRKISFYILFLSLLSGCSQPVLFKENRLLMDTFAEISCLSPDKSNAMDAMDEAFKEMRRIEKVFSKFDKDSELSRLNRSAGKEEVIVSPGLFGIIERSINYSKISGGSFDITAGSKTQGRYKDILLDRGRGSVRFLSRDIKIDLGGIAKGYAVDRARDILSSYGIKNALVNIGGNMFALGSPPGRESWRIGIRDPKDKRNIIYKLSLKDRAVSTSGDYERPFHIINPFTGNPAEDIGSVTIVADSAEEADALSTAVFVMGIQEGLKFVKTLKDVEVYIVN